jgi:EAL domain-containing protein (putative c-di-GMP-specific phosphodiesterase class I)/CheY-like chemotaxis protein
VDSPQKTLTQPLRALVIDDDPRIRLVAVRQLRHLGLKVVHTAADGAEALQAIEAAAPPFDVALCDLSMPNEDGLVFLRRLACCANKPAVIIISGEDPLVLDAARRLGMSHNLDVLGVASKPFTLNTLQEILSRLNEPSQTSEPAESATHSTAVQLLDATEIERSLEAGWFETWFQPQMELQSRRIVGVEALLRLRHPENGLMSPASFIGPAEESGLIRKLTDYVVDQGLTWCRFWRQAEYPLSVSINLSVGALTDLDYPDSLTNLCGKRRVDPGDVVLELTESSLATDSKVLLDIVTRLRLKGFRLSIDDFGTGYSSLEQLQSLPFNELKIDKRFVEDATRSIRSALILQNSLDLAARLKMSTVAEGVETNTGMQLVSRLGCDRAQGYLVAKPMPGDDLLPWLQDSVAV